MKLLKLFVGFFLVLPALFVAVVMACPYFLICNIAGLSQETLDFNEKLGIAVRDKVQDWCEHGTADDKLPGQ